MILTLGFIPAVTIAESGPMQLAITLKTEADQNRQIKTERKKDNQIVKQASRGQRGQLNESQVLKNGMW